MKPTKSTVVIYWITTSLLALFILPGIFFANSEMAIEGTKHLGFPLWFHWELSIAKFIGGILLIIPMIPKRLKEWTYVAFGIDFISACIALIATDGFSAMALFPLFTMALLIVSYITYHRVYKDKPF